ncbi:MAG: CoA transferase [Mycobacteriales bacterium]
MTPPSPPTNAAPTGDAAQPLAHLRVVELGQLLAGPFCGQLLGDFGAEVSKVGDLSARHRPDPWPAATQPNMGSGRSTLGGEISS